MSTNENILKIEQIIDIILRHRWLIIIPLCLSIATGIYLSITLPKIYSAKTVILVEPQRVPSNFVKSIISTDINKRINTISQQILSRSNLEKIIKEFNIFKGPQYKNMYLEDKLGSLKKRIRIKVTNTRNGADAFSISFTGKNPDMVMKVVNTIASFFINQNIKEREAQAVSTSHFLFNELSSMRVRLEKVENNVKTYRRKNMGELPEQLDSNLRSLDRLQLLLTERQRNLIDAKNRYTALLTVAKNYSDTGMNHDTPSHPEIKPISELDLLKRNLALLRKKYTDRHPDIIRLKKNINEYEPNRNEIPVSPGRLLKKQMETTVSPVNNQEIQKIYIEINTLENEIKDIKNEITIYENRIENTPKREQELMALKRDYDNIKSLYNSLLNRKLEADISANMEKKQKGEQFHIIDYAHKPEKPISPNMQKLFLLTIASGIGLGLGLIFLIEFFNNRITHSEQIENTLNLPVLAQIPEMLQTEEILKRRTHTMITLFSLFLTFCLFAGYSLIMMKGADQTLNILRKFINV